MLDSQRLKALASDLAMPVRGRCRPSPNRRLRRARISLATPVPRQDLLPIAAGSENQAFKRPQSGGPSALVGCRETGDDIADVIGKIEMVNGKAILVCVYERFRQQGVSDPGRYASQMVGSSTSGHEAGTVGAWRTLPTDPDRSGNYYRQKTGLTMIATLDNVYGSQRLHHPGSAWQPKLSGRTGQGRHE